MDSQRQKKAAIRDERIFSERKSKYRGTVLVDLPGLQYDTCDSVARLSKQKKGVRKLTNAFSLEGCCRLADGERYVSALISEDELREAVERSNISADALRSDGLPPKLIIPPSKPLKCLDGQHRLAAADKHLSQGDDWWVVDLYSDGLYASNLAIAFTTDTHPRRQRRTANSSTRGVFEFNKFLRRRDTLPYPLVPGMQ
jgi:hypothetical protein